ncbi:ABC transporter-related protein [Chloroherpeton thalassium ATCC 35110]|uniref:ABC transporter-related protein n=1 Tax=Chloroherpeton thalassium (strain ATCC 35110 / GB-78) TaxID=517418 RepID=B3QX88_CHLT3|nr:ABC transporter ATP-binding protein [Chloroherpeton thalassium]ACF14898.1 ABC transporter-related protein [Chloroherpeton thalassium ATCC 35110]
MRPEVLRTHALTIGYQGKKHSHFGRFGKKSSAKKPGHRIRTIVKDLVLELNRGELVCLLGPNGAGKSTLMRTLSGIQMPLAGSIDISGKPISKMSSKEIALHLSIVLTERITVGNLSVYALVALGRSPYTGWMGNLSKDDEQIVREAIEITGTEPFVNAHLSDLSDGERQKVMIARALAQDTPIILLDEPTAHLDLPNRVEIIRLLRKLTQEKGKSILMSTHELDLALQAADKIWLMQEKKDGALDAKSELLAGIPEELILNGQFEKAFARDGFLFDRATGAFQIHHPTSGKIGLIGNGAPGHWTKRALERLGFQVCLDEFIYPRVEIDSEKCRDVWCYFANEAQAPENLYSISELIRALQTQRTRMN